MIKRFFDYFGALALAIVLFVATDAHAQQLKVATGGVGGTYSKMFQQTTQVCGTSIGLIEQNTSGSNDNVNMIVGNLVNGALVQSDVLFFRGKTEDLGNIKTLLALHPEEVHVLALGTALTKTGGVAGIGAKPIVLSTVKDLAGVKVGAAGGSYVTAQVIRLQAEIPFSVTEFPDNKALVAALDAGQVDAAVIVGGSPFEAVARLKGDYKLLPFPEDTVGRLKSVYRPARLNYSNIRAAGVNSVATDALFITREYKTAKFIDALSKYRACILANLDDLKESTGMHPKWQLVDPANKGKWPYLELPEPAVAKVVKAGK